MKIFGGNSNYCGELYLQFTSTKGRLQQISNIQTRTLVSSPNNPRTNKCMNLINKEYNVTCIRPNIYNDLKTQDSYSQDSYNDARANLIFALHESNQ